MITSVDRFRSIEKPRRGQKIRADEQKTPVLQSTMNVRKTMDLVGPIQFIYGAGTRCAGPQLRMRRALSARDEGGICTDTFQESVGFESRFGRHEFVRESRQFHESSYHRRSTVSVTETSPFQLAETTGENATLEMELGSGIFCNKVQRTQARARLRDELLTWLTPNLSRKHEHPVNRCRLRDVSACRHYNPSG